jgi:hypothetical protein
VIRLQSPAEIRFQLCRVYSDNEMSDSCVREGCRKFRDGRTDVYDKGGQGHSIVTHKLVQKVEQYARGKHRFTRSELSEEFPHTSRTTLYRIVMDRLGYHKFCARWVPWMESTIGCITWRHRSLTRDYKN